MATVNQYKGYSLFNDVEDKVSQTYNRARVMKNMMLDHSDTNKVVSDIGQTMLMTYFTHIPESDRQAVHTKLAELLQQKEAA